MKKVIGIWRVQPLPAPLGYVTPAAASARTVSRFGVTSLLMGCTLVIGLAAAAWCLAPLSSREGDWIAVAALPICSTGCAFGVVGAIRRSKRRLAGLLGILINVGVGLGVVMRWLITHASP